MTDTPVLWVVDDDEGIRDMLEVMAVMAGWQARTFPSAEAFLDAYDRREHACLLLDVQLPGISGLALLKRLHASTDLPIIVLSGHANVRMAVEALRLGAQDFFEKPFDLNRLLSRVRQVLSAEAEKHRQQGLGLSSLA
ncbi:MAG: response regulator [Pseudomonadota bacterium]|nr:response regulator [Pseudomonadota bacterium]